MSVMKRHSSRKSATNSVLWFFGEDIPGVPNKRTGGICFGSKVAPIFYNTMEDAGSLVFEAPVDNIAYGDIIEIRPYDGKKMKLRPVSTYVNSPRNEGEQCIEPLPA